MCVCSSIVTGNCSGFTFLFFLFLFPLDGHSWLCSPGCLFIYPALWSWTSVIAAHPGARREEPQSCMQAWR